MTGLYAYVRHPQYTGLAVVGLGSLLLWPRALVTYVAMLLACTTLAWVDEDELQAAYRAARFDRRVQKALDQAGPGRLIVYVVSQKWVLPDLPLEPVQEGDGGRREPATFDRRHYKVLFARPRTHAASPEGRSIV